MAVTRVVWSLAALLLVFSLVSCDTQEDIDAPADLNERGEGDRAPRVYVPGRAGKEGQYGSQCSVVRGVSKCSTAVKGNCNATDHGECYQLIKDGTTAQAPCCCRTWYYYYQTVSFWQWINGHWTFWTVCGEQSSVLAGACWTSDINKPCCQKKLSEKIRNRCRQRWQTVKFLYCSRSRPYRMWVWRGIPHHCYCAKLW